MLNGRLYQPNKEALVIKEKEFGLLPTPLASDPNRKAKFKQGGTPLRAAIDQKMLPTPNTMDYLPPRGLDSMIKQTQKHRKGRKQIGNLREAVNPVAVELFNKLQNLPTPCSRDYKDAGENLNFKKIAEKGKLSGVLNHTYLTQTGKGTYLNPPFVEEMMGYPIGWTDYAPSETA